CGLVCDLHPGELAFANGEKEAKERVLANASKFVARRPVVRARGLAPLRGCPRSSQLQVGCGPLVLNNATRIAPVSTFPYAGSHCRRDSQQTLRRAALHPAQSRCMALFD